MALKVGQGLTGTGLYLESIIEPLGTLRFHELLPILFAVQRHVNFRRS